MRPFVHVNCAMSADGKIAGDDRKQVKISSREDKDRVKGLRMKYDAILVGVGTIIADDPHLTVKNRPIGENQVRIVIDPHGRTPDTALVLDERAETVIVTAGSCQRTWKNADVIRCRGDIVLSEALEALYGRGIRSILVEGGGTTISSFFREGLVDEYTVFVGSLIIGGKNAPTPADGDGWVMPEGLRLTFKGCQALGDGALLTYSVD